MRVWVVGGSGMLGTDVVSKLRASGHEVWAPESSALDITDSTGMVLEVLEEVTENGPFKWCVNCAAYTAVDKAESDIAAATALNVVGPTGLAALCAAQKIRLLHISTDFVFDGTKRTPYTEMDQPNPLGVYGATKLEGERGVQANDRRAVIVRTSWLFGAHGSCFPQSIVKAWLDGRELRVVADQVGTPTNTVDLARSLVWLIKNGAPGGVYHAGGTEVMSWHVFAKLCITTYRESKAETPPVPEIAAISTSEWPTAAERPMYSALDSSKLLLLGAPPMRPIEEALRSMWNLIV